MSLVIVESPAKCRKIEGYLGTGFTCMASVGHIRGLDNTLGIRCIDTSGDFAPTFRILPEKQKQVSALRKAIAKAKDVVLATDDDREGEGIAWHICQVFGLDVGATKRIIFHEITGPAIRGAMSRPGRINMNVVHAQIARQVLDYVVGYTLSPMLWAHVARNSKAKLSAGRCQTPALRLVYDNQADIDASPGRLAYNTTGFFMTQNIPYVLGHCFDTEDEVDPFLEESVNFDHVFQRIMPRVVVEKPPKPFTTSGLQQSASSLLRISPKDTMSTAQKLYEGGHITYMRTDSKTYSDVFLESARAKIVADYGEKFVSETLASMGDRPVVKTKTKTNAKPKKNTKTDDGNAQEAHEAIRPTNIDVRDIEGTSRERRLYTLIWQTTMESCMSPAQCLVLSTTITAPGDRAYKHYCKEVTFPGWKAVAGVEPNPLYQYLVNVKCGVIPYRKISSKVTLKETKGHYTEAKLVQLLEEKGIGRPSTFSSLIDKIEERKYVAKEDVTGRAIQCVDFELEDDTIERLVSEREFGNEKGKLTIQAVGTLVVEFLVKHYDSILNYDYTKGMEDKLDAIARGEAVWHELCRECYTEIMRISNPLERSHQSNKVSIRLDEHHVYIIGKHGPVVKVDKDGKTTFKPVKEGVNLDDLRSGALALSDVVAESNPGKLMGRYEGHDLTLKDGKFGLYAAWGTKTKSFSWVAPDVDITYDFIVDHIGKPPASVVREINELMSIRTGKYGHYLFYKTDTMKKPKFVTLRDFTHDYLSCDKASVVEYALSKI